MLNQIVFFYIDKVNLHSTTEILYHLGYFKNDFLSRKNRAVIIDKVTGVPYIIINNKQNSFFSSDAVNKEKNYNYIYEVARMYDKFRTIDVYYYEKSNNVNHFVATNIYHKI